MNLDVALCTVHSLNQHVTAQDCDSLREYAVSNKCSEQDEAVTSRSPKNETSRLDHCSLDVRVIPEILEIEKKKEIGLNGGHMLNEYSLRSVFYVKLVFPP